MDPIGRPSYLPFIDAKRDAGAKGDGTTDDTAALNAALAAMTTGGFLWLDPASNFKITGPLVISYNGITIAGANRGSTVITSTSATASFSVANNVQYLTLKDFSLTRSGGAAVAGQDGIQMLGYNQFVYMDNVEVSLHWNGFRLGSTAYSYCHNIFANNNYNDGIHCENNAAVGSLQWTFSKSLTQQNNGYGLIYQTAAGPTSVTCGELLCVSTFANKLGGFRFVGSVGVPLQAVRINGGFVGQDGADGVYLDTYNSSTHKIQGLELELAGTSACGVNLGTAITNVGRGMTITANNTDVMVLDCVAIGNSYSGLKTDGTYVQFIGCESRLNGAAAVAGEKYGFHLASGNATLTGSTARANDVGVRLDNDSHVVVGNDLRTNTTAGLTSVTLVNSQVQGNLGTTLSTVSGPVTATNTFFMNGAGLAGVTTKLNLFMSRSGHTTAYNGVELNRSDNADFGLLAMQGSSNNGTIAWLTANTLGIYAPNRLRMATGVSATNYTEVTNGGVSVTGGNVTLAAAGDGVLVKEGANATMGIATLVAGTVTVNTTKVTANSRIMLTHQISAGTRGSAGVTARVAGTSFTITSTNAADTSTVAWMIVEPAP